MKSEKSNLIFLFHNEYLRKKVEKQVEFLLTQESLAYSSNPEDCLIQFDTPEIVRLKDAISDLSDDDCKKIGRYYISRKGKIAKEVQSIFVALGMRVYGKEDNN